jgi:hypothetical protein
VTFLQHQNVEWCLTPFVSLLSPAVSLQTSDPTSNSLLFSMTSSTFQGQGTNLSLDYCETASTLLSQLPDWWPGWPSSICQPCDPSIQTLCVLSHTWMVSSFHHDLPRSSSLPLTYLLSFPCSTENCIKDTIGQCTQEMQMAKEYMDGPSTSLGMGKKVKSILLITSAGLKNGDPGW